MSKKILATNITKSKSKPSKSSKVKANTECQFPFIHKGQLQNECLDGTKKILNLENGVLQK